ncbi:UvrD-helicase domain-containing protein [Chloracidobacterium thermophilum]|nr:UvrD-helicase domain-containing protein [Chloracidobacterium thermophilum]QUV78126.1 UvrD-helicase domain-containing protein [Chloracidobacterium thermophilum]
MEARECLSLSDEQRRAVEAPLGSNLVIAGPGTGKTRTLAYRVAYVIQTLGVPPDNILAVTYTNKATEEMRYRLRWLLPDEAGRLTIGTFHSFCIRLLRQHHAHLDLPGTSALPMKTRKSGCSSACAPTSQSKTPATSCCTFPRSGWANSRIWTHWPEKIPSLPSTWPDCATTPSLTSTTFWF